MCGRFTMFSDDQDLVQLFDIELVEGEHAPSYNQAPSQMVRSVRRKSDDRRELGLMQWGLLPFWANESFKPLINARAETLTVKPSFKQAALKRRCLIPTNGYYEWMTVDENLETIGSSGLRARKQPYFLSLAGKGGLSAAPGNEPIMAMAGVFDWPKRGVEGAATTCAVVTREAVDTLGEIHPRMPLFIPRSQWDLWLDPELEDPDELQQIIDAVPPAPLAPRIVSPAVGNVRNNSLALIEPYDPGDTAAVGDLGQGVLL